MLSEAMAPPVETPTPGAPETMAVRSMFDRIAPRYDLLNRVLSAGVDRRWRRQAVAFLGLSGEATVLDLCTGTGDLLLDWLGREPGRKGFGVDLASAMLVRGAAKLAASGVAARSGLLSGDVARLPLRGGAFDGAMVAFGIRNVLDVDAALREAHRVLRPGGRLVILEFSMPRGAFGRVYRFYFDNVLPLVGGWLSGDCGAYRYLPSSVRRFDAPEELRRRLEAAGFASVAQKPLSLGIAWLHRGEKP